MNRIRPELDVILDLLKDVQQAKPDSVFINSLLYQYQERGGLSKKQLEGLYQKAVKVDSIPGNRLATLEAIIRKKPTKYKSQLPAATPLYERDEHAGSMLTEILAKYPQHKRILYLQSKFTNNESFTATENAELLKFYKLLV